MVIDFHTHIWPDKIAAKVVASLGSSIGKDFVPFSDGTADGLFARMKENSVDFSVIQPVVTKPSQTTSVNQFAAALNQNPKFDGRLISFAGIWPYSENYKAEIDDICAKGLKGIKLHPEYQQFFVNEEKLLPLFDYALSRGLILLFHAGLDPSYEGCHSTPKMFAELRKKLGGGTIVAAHLGGIKQTEQVLEDLMGSGVYIDTSIEYGTEKFLQVIKSHGADKVLFATDSPWGDAKAEIEIIKKLPLQQNEIVQILGLNAKSLLGL